jgi:hypothetical protein
MRFNVTTLDNPKLRAALADALGGLAATGAGSRHNHGPARDSRSNDTDTAIQPR